MPAYPSGAGGIIGVASDSSDSSVMVYNNRQKYNEWEFIAILGQTGQQCAGQWSDSGASQWSNSGIRLVTPPPGNRQPESQPLKRP